MRKSKLRWIIPGVLLLTAIGIVWVAYRYDRDIESARERISTGTIAQTHCGPIEYASVGTGTPILMVHGAGGGFDQGLDFSGELVARGFRVIAMSRFGYLRTPLPSDASAAAQADAHACLLDALNIKGAAIIGASAGAPSAMQFALRHPDRCAGLVLIVPAAYVPRPGGAPSLSTPSGTDLLFATALRWDFLFWSGPKIAPDTFARAILATPPEVIRNADAQERARVSMMMRHILPVSSRRQGLLNDARVTSSLPRYPLEDIHAPTLAISVKDDLYGTYDAARYTADHIPQARFKAYDTGGHLWVGHHREVIADITSFLKSQPISKDPSR